MFFLGDQFSSPGDDADDSLARLGLRDLPQGRPGVEVGGRDTLDAHHIARLKRVIAGIDAEVGLQAANAVACHIDVANEIAGIGGAVRVDAIIPGCAYVNAVAAR